MIKNGNFLEYDLLQGALHQCSVEIAHCQVCHSIVTIQASGFGLISEQRNVIIHFLYSYFCLRKCCSITAKSAFLRERMMSMWSRVLCARTLQLESHFSEVLGCCLGAVGTRISSTLMLVTSFPRRSCCWTLGTVVVAVWDLADMVILVIDVSCIMALS